MSEDDEEDGDLTDIAMDEALMLNQEPSPEYDLDDEQRPRISRVGDLLLLPNKLRPRPVAVTNVMMCASWSYQMATAGMRP